METKLIELLKLCIEKDLNFDYSITNVITISRLNNEKESFEIYIRENISEYNLNELIEKVKNYKN